MLYLIVLSSRTPPFEIEFQDPRHVILYFVLQKGAPRREGGGVKINIQLYCIVNRRDQIMGWLHKVTLDWVELGWVGSGLAVLGEEVAKVLVGVQAAWVVGVKVDVEEGLGLVG